MTDKEKKIAQDVFKKDEKTMSSIERMMAQIIAEEETVPEPEKIEPVKVERIAPKPPKPQNRKPVEVKPVYRPEEPSLANEKKPEAKEVPMPRSDNAKKAKRARLVRMAPVIIVLCTLMLIGVVVLGSMIKSIAGDEDAVDNFTDTVDVKPTPDDGMVIPTPEPEEGEIVEPGIVVKDSEEPEEGISPTGERYVFTKADISWLDAEKACQEAGGHLVTISDEDELNRVIELAEKNGVDRIWIGCQRMNGQLVWENGEDITFYTWAAGEPSVFDVGDGAHEDYVLLWKLNGTWAYNDSRNDPVAGFPEMYAGTIGYICEYDNEE